MKNSLERALIIVFLGAALGLIGNAVSPRGIPFITPPKKAPKQDEFIKLEKAKELWSSGAAVFLDAREPVDYAAGHIGNALNLPALAFERHFGEVAPFITPDAQIMSHHLADSLRQQSYTNVHILFNGWTTWTNAGFPTEQGSAK